MREAWRVAAVVLLALPVMVASDRPAHGQEPVVESPPMNLPEDVRIVQTIPPMAGIEFAVGEQRKTTNVSGRAVFRNVPPGAFGADTGGITVPREPVLVTPRSRARFVRLYGRSNGSYRIATFNIDHRVRLRFGGIDGSEVADDAIDTVEIRSSIGEELSFRPRDGTEIWLHGSRVVPLHGNLETKPVAWTVDDVVVHGASVVNRAQHRFFPLESDDVMVNLLFFEANLRVRDAFFGFATGEAVLLETPGGAVERHRLDDGRVGLTSLPRGEYRVTVLGPGLRIPRPLAISRNQEADLKLYTWLDCAVAAAAVLTFVVGLPLVGRLRRSAHRRRRLVAPRRRLFRRRRGRHAMGRTARRRTPPLRQVDANAAPTDDAMAARHPVSVRR